jgi:integrase
MNELTLANQAKNWHRLKELVLDSVADAAKISIGERKELMGHANAEMTLHYTHTSSDQAREVLERLAGKLVNAADLGGQERSNVVLMRKASGL